MTTKLSEKPRVPIPNDIKRKSQPKKLRPDKDAAWMLKQADDMSYTATKTFVRRMRAIAKRLNGGVEP